jgi:hypothetical protein
VTADVKTSDLAAFLAAQMADAETQWSLGTFGAIAEFARDPDEPAALTRGAASLAAVTQRGGIRIDLQAGMRPFAFETTTKDSWNHRVALCLPQEHCAMNGRTVLTELGGDSGALRERDRDAVLFDLGLGALQVDCCVRLADPEGATARPLWTPGVRQPGDGHHPRDQPAPRVPEPARTHRGVPADPATGWQEPGRSAHPRAAGAAAPPPHPRRDRAARATTHSSRSCAATATRNFSR